MKLIKKIDEVLAIIPVPMTSELEVIAPYFGITERTIIRLIGRAQFDALVTAYNIEEQSEVSAKMKEAIKSAQRVIVNLGYLTAIPVLSVKMSSSGILINSNADTKQAFAWQVGDVKRSLRELGFSAIEDLLELLESDPTEFAEYHASDEYREAKQYLIKSAADFTRYYNIGGSRYVFHSLAYIMKRVEEQELSGVFGSAYIKKLHAEPPTSGEELRLLNDYLKPGVALLTAAKALRERIITFENGIATINLHGNYDAAKKEQVPDKATIDAAYDQLVRDAMQYLQEGLDIIVEFPEAFPDYVVPVIGRKFNIRNDRNNGIYAT